MHPHTRENRYFFLFKSKYRCLHKSRKKRRGGIPTRIREILWYARGEIKACQIIIVSRRYLSRVHEEDESPILRRARALVDRRTKWPQRIPFSRSAVVTFGGPKFLTLQITSTRKRKSAVYFVCGQSERRVVPLRSSCEEFDADEARSKDSSNPPALPLH